MKSLLITLSDELKQSEGLDGFWNRSLSAFRQYGVDGVCFATLGSGLSFDGNRPTRSFFYKCNYPKLYFDTFGTETFLDNDASVEHCYHGAKDVFLWHNEAIIPELPAKQKARVFAERDIGFGVGVTVPASRFDERANGGIGLRMADVSVPEFAKYWSLYAEDILTICAMLDAGMRKTHLREIIDLSPRERECLTWIAAGLRTDQVARRLKISDGSVEKYVKNARKKLKAASRDQAVATALIFGLIQP